MQQAFQLIKAGRKQDAVKLLVPLLKQDKNNVNAWWLMANALEDKDKKEKALEAVLRLKPDHTAAKEMLAQMKPPPPPADEFDYDDDPFAVDGESDDAFAAPSSMYTRDDDPFADADDPFADDDDDPFAPAAVSGGRRQRGQQNFESDPFANVYDQEIDLLRKPKRSSSSSSNNNAIMMIGGIVVIVLIGAIAFLITMNIVNQNTVPTGPCEASDVQVAAVRDAIYFTDSAGFEMQGCIGLGQTRGGDVRNPDLYLGYSFYGEAGQSVQIDLESTTFSNLDPILHLFDSNGGWLASNDDVALSRGNLNSRITYTLPATGAYIVVAESFGGSTGGFNLTVR